MVFRISFSHSFISKEIEVLKFVSSSTAENGDVQALYNAMSKPDKTHKEGATFAVKLVAGEAGAKAVADLDAPAAKDEEEAFDNLATALERCAKAIRERGQANRGVPIYG
jgi:hypothetical protein